MNQNTPQTATNATPSFALGSPEFEAECRKEFAPILAQLDQPQFTWPATTEAIVQLLADAEYRIDRDSLLRMLDEKVIPMPQRTNGRLVWGAADAWALVAAMEFRRMWKPLSRRHDYKKTGVERMQELAVASGAPGHFVDLEKWDLAGLLALLLEPGCDLPARQAIAVAIKAKLHSLGIEV